MPWHVAKSGSCPTSRPWAVIKDSDGEVEGCHPTKTSAEDQMAALYASEGEMKTETETLEEIRDTYGTFGRRETRTLPIVVEEIRDSDAGHGQYTVRGHAAVYERWSLDLGGFREKVKKGAFDEVLGGDPDVHLFWDHDSRLTLARTRNKTLELRDDPVGLHYWARVAPTSYAQDLRVLLDRRDIDQASFAFTVAPDGDHWDIREEDGKEVIERTITKIGALYDVTITAQGAYPQTDSSVVRSLARAYAEKHLEPSPPDTAEIPVEEDEDSVPAPESADIPVEDEQGEEPLGDQDSTPTDPIAPDEADAGLVEPDEEVEGSASELDESDGQPTDLAALKRFTRELVRREKEDFLRIIRR